MRLGYVMAHVESVAATLAFWNQAFGLATRFQHESGGYGELDTGATVLAFASLELAATHVPAGIEPLSRTERPTGIEVALVADDVAAAWQRALQAGAAPVAAPSVKPWGQTVAYVRDNNGLLVELCTAMG